MFTPSKLTKSQNKGRERSWNSCSTPTPVVPVRRSPSPKPTAITAHRSLVRQRSRLTSSSHVAPPLSVPSYRSVYNERASPDVPTQYEPMTSRLLRFRTQSSQSLQQQAGESMESSRPRMHSPYRAVRRPVNPNRNCDQHSSDQIEISRTTKSLFPRTKQRKALCIGINYKGQERELRGCVNDAWNMSEFLKSFWNYAVEDIMVLTDEPYNLKYMPTKRNILSALRWLVQDAQPGDCLFFHYSGHGGRIIDLDGRRVDGFEKAIHPVDWECAGEIVTEVLYDVMVKPLPTGCRLTALFDSCHSGTVLDLPYIYRASGRLKPNSRALVEYPQAHVVLFAGCSDLQGSGGIIMRGGEFHGAMSSAFISSLTANPTQAYLQVLASVQEILRRTQRQTPQLSSSYPIDASFRCLL